MSPLKKIKNSNILYIEDDDITRIQFKKYLESQCKTLYTASDGSEGFNLYQEYRPDIVITDIEMPLLNGLEMARKIREISLSTQIIIISAHIKPEYLLEAVNLQLVQYLIKPISLKKITEVLSLSAQYINTNNVNARKFLSEDIYYDSYTKELFSSNEIINLSKYERALLEIMIERYPAPVSYELIDAQIYDYGASKNAIKLLVSSLREKVKKESVSNVPGFGYKINLTDGF